MSPLRRAEVHLFKNPTSPEIWSLPASGATVVFYGQGATVTSAVEVHEHDTVTVPVSGVGSLLVGDNVSATGGPDRDFQVRSIGTNSMQLDYVGTDDIILAVGDRIHPSTPLQAYSDPNGQYSISSATVDSSGSVTVYMSAQKFDYLVSGTSAGSAAGYYADSSSGGGEGYINSRLNARDFASIQAAIDALPPWGGTVLVPAGHYQLTETLYLPCDRPCQLVGEGRHDDFSRGTVLEWTTNVGMVRVRGDYSSVRDMTLRNTSGGQSSREDQGYGIAIARRNVVDAHPHPEPITSSAATEYARGGNNPIYSVSIENVVIHGSPGWGIYVPGYGKLSDESTAEYDRVAPGTGNGNGTLAFSLNCDRVRVRDSQKYGACFLGTGCTTLYFDSCSFLNQGAGQVPNSTYYAYLAGCEHPLFDRCIFEGLSPSGSKEWVRLCATMDAVFDRCWFENDPPTDSTPPTYFLQLVPDGSTPCRGGSIRHCRFIRGSNCDKHMSILKLASGGSIGFHIVGSGGVSAEEAWNASTNSFAGPAHFDLGGDTNAGVVLNGTPTFRDRTETRHFQPANVPRASTLEARSLGRLPGSSTSQLFSNTFDDPSIRLEGNLVMNWDLPGDNQSVGCPMYRWGGTSSAPKWRLVNNAPTLTQNQRDARSNWVQGDMILVLDDNNVLQLQVRLDSGWKTVTIS